MMWVAAGRVFRCLELPAGVTLYVPGALLVSLERTVCPSGLQAVVWLVRGERERQPIVVIRSAHRGHPRVTQAKEVVMVTTIGVDPHKATHTAVAIDESETVLGEITLRADRSQAKTLIGWADRVDGDGRVWAVEAAGGLGYLLSQQLVASGERVVDVPPVLASRVRVLGSGRSGQERPKRCPVGGGGCSPPAGSR